MHVNLELLFKTPICLAQCQAFYSVLGTDGIADDRVGHTPCSFTGKKATLGPHCKLGSIFPPEEKAAEACA